MRFIADDLASLEEGGSYITDGIARFEELLGKHAEFVRRYGP